MTEPRSTAGLMKARVPAAFLVIAAMMTASSSPVTAEEQKQSSGMISAYGDKYYLGVNWQDATMVQAGQDVPCVWISFVYPHSPASTAKIVPGFLTRVDDKRVHNTREAAKALDASSGTVSLRMFIYNQDTGLWDRKDYKDVKLGELGAEYRGKKIEP